MENSHTTPHRKDRSPKIIWPSLMLAGLFWLLLGLLILFVDPQRVADFGVSSSYLLFFGLLWLAVFYTVALVFHSSRRGVLTAVGISLYAFFRLKGIGTVLNFVLLVGFLTVFDRYLTTRR